MATDLMLVQEDDISIATNLEVKIYTIRGKKVILDYDQADLYSVETSALNRQVKRNIERFPADFMMLQFMGNSVLDWQSLKNRQNAGW